MRLPIKKLSEVAQINPRRPPIIRNDDEPTSFVPMENVDDVKGTIAHLNTVPYAKIRTGYTYFTNGDVIFAKITPCMQNGKHAVAEGLIDGFGFGSYRVSCYSSNRRNKLGMDSLFSASQGNFGCCNKNVYRNCGPTAQYLPVSLRI